MPPTYTNDHSFEVHLNKIIEDHMHEESFGVTRLAEEMAMSRASLYRRVKRVTNTTISHIICERRLKKSKELLKDKGKTISEIAYEVGFSNVSYFIKCFHEHYGHSPGEIRKNGWFHSLIPDYYISKIKDRCFFILILILIFVLAIFIILLLG